MKRLMIGVAICCMTAMSFGAEEVAKDELTQKIDKLLEKAPNGPHGGKIITPELKALMDQRAGGLVIPKTNGKTFLLVDARGTRDGFLDAYVENLKKRLFLGVSPVKKAIDRAADAFELAQGMKTAQNPAVVMIVEREKKPVLSIFPEDAIGIVNAMPLRKNADEKLYQARLSKEVWRCLTLALGGGSMAAPNGRIAESILSPVHSVEDLDRLKSVGPSPSLCNGVYDSVSGIGLEAARPTIYSMACRQGWAPTPTNAIQKAIWDKIHKLPSTPIKIKPEAKKVKE